MKKTSISIFIATIVMSLGFVSTLSASASEATVMPAIVVEAGEGTWDYGRNTVA